MGRRIKSPEAFGFIQAKLSLETVKKVSEEPVVVVEEKKEQGPVVADERTRWLARSDQRVIPIYDRRDRKGRLVQRTWHPQGRTSGSAGKRRRSGG